MLINRLIQQLFLKISRISRVHPNLVRAKHSGTKYLPIVNKLSTGMLRPYGYICTHWMLPISRYQNWHMRVILTTLSLPVFFTASATAQVSKTIKASESQAKQYVQAMNKAQQDYYAQNTGFTSSIANLALGMTADSAKYKYSISTGNKAVFNYGVSQQSNLKSFVGGVFLVGNMTKTILCQTNAASKTKPATPTNNNGVLACGVNTVQVVR